MKNLIFLFLYTALVSSCTQHNEGPRVDETFKHKDIIRTDHKPSEFYDLGNGNYFVVFGKTYFGTLELELEPSRDGNLIVELSEKKREGKSVDDNPPGTVRYVRDTLHLIKGKKRYRVEIPQFEGPSWFKGRPFNIALPDTLGNVTPFRYVNISGYEGELESANITQVGYHYPFNETASEFRSSSPELEKIWEFCKHSIKATSFTGLYIDGDRERRPYEGDTYINQLSHYVVDREYAMTRRTVDHLFANPTWPTEWAFHMHLILWTDYMYTGNKDYMVRYYDSLKAIIDRQVLSEQGLIMNVNNQDIIDWPVSERDGYQVGMVNNVPNAFYYRSLVIMSQISQALNRKTEGNAYMDKAKRHKKAFQDAFWNEESGLFIDALDSIHASSHANLFPLVFGLASEEQADRIIPFLKNKGMSVSVYAAQYLLDALFIYGQDDYAIDLITSYGHRGWLYMIEQGGTITWEAWSEKVKENLDWNHAWGAAPGNVIARRILGIRPSLPGFAKTHIEPQPGKLTYISLTHPLPKGEIYVELSRSGETITILIRSEMVADLIIRDSFVKIADIEINRKEEYSKLSGENLQLLLQPGENIIRIFSSE